MANNDNPSQIQTADASPVASSLIETFRSIGYSFETALADIIDNAITANATEIRIHPVWAGGKSYVTIVDNGYGMSNQELIAALVPGSKNPLQERTEKDLGRFGLGLKTASFSQCRCLSVVSKKKGLDTVYWTWSLDHVAKTNRWEIIRWVPEEFVNILDNYVSGTAVIWTQMDRLVFPDVSERNEKIKRKFMDTMGKAEFHLGMVFHKYLQEEIFKLWWGLDHQILPWDPFCTYENNRRPQSEECLKSGINTIGTAKGYILPSEQTFSSPQNHLIAGGKTGWSNMQGFYVYRGKRLLVAATWLGLRRKELHSQLARIEIIIPNNLDELWQIDIKKSNATPPSEIRDQLSDYAREMCALSELEFRQRRSGKKFGQMASFEPLWIENIKSDKTWSFTINRESAILAVIKEKAKDNPISAINMLLRLIETTLPTRSIYIRESDSSSKKTVSVTEDNDTLRSIIKTIYNNLLSTGISKTGARARLRNMEPINQYEQLIEEICK